MKFSVTNSAVTDAAPAADRDRLPNDVWSTSSVTRAGDTVSTNVTDSVSPSQTIRTTNPQQGRTNRAFSIIDTLPPTEPATMQDQDQQSDNNMNCIAKRGRLFAKRQSRRLVQKGGECNVTGVCISNRKRKYLADIFTTLIEMQWRYHVVFFALQFIVSWCAFGAVYYAIAAVHDDTNHVGNETWVPCINNVYDYTSAFLFSLETQSTIGYGVRVINPVCEFAMIIVVMQTCVGTFIQMLATGLLFAKISRPKGRAKTLMFSRTAVICRRDGQYQLMFRVGDVRTKSHIIGTSIRALMVRSKLLSDNEVMPLSQRPLSLYIDMSEVDDTFLFMVWPVTVVHKIDEASPLWDVSAEQLIAEQFEIIVILEGTVESTGSSTQVRTSYLPSEIQWGQCFQPLRTSHTQNGLYVIDYSNFHNTLPVAMPDFSARRWTAVFTNRANITSY